MSLGNRTVPRSIRGTPNRRQYTPKTAPRAATRRSHHRASSRPPATAWPSTAATTGFDRYIRVGPMGPLPSTETDTGRGSPVARALRSAPAQKVPPAPVRTATARLGSASKPAKASARAPAVGPSTALRTSGRSMVTMATGPSVTTLTFMADHCGAWPWWGAGRPGPLGPTRAGLRAPRTPCGGCSGHRRERLCCGPDGGDAALEVGHEVVRSAAQGDAEAEALVHHQQQVAGRHPATVVEVMGGDGHRRALVGSDAEVDVGAVNGRHPRSLPGAWPGRHPIPPGLSGRGSSVVPGRL